MRKLTQLSVKITRLYDLQDVYAATGQAYELLQSIRACRETKFDEPIMYLIGYLLEATDIQPYSPAVTFWHTENEVKRNYKVAVSVEQPRTTIGTSELNLVYALHHNLGTHRSHVERIDRELLVRSHSFLQNLLTLLDDPAAEPENPAAFAIDSLTGANTQESKEEDPGFTFANTEELLTQATKDRACRDGREWCRDRPLQAILENIPHKYRLWCLMRGYTQFAEHCDWSRYTGEEWGWLLAKQPRFAEHCDWGKLRLVDWDHVLRHQPQLSR